MTRASSRAVITALLFGAACGHTKHAATGDKQHTLHVRVEADVRTNGGMPFYSMVSAIDPKAAPLPESYQRASEQLFATPADPEVLLRFPIIPGERNEMQLEVPPDRALLVYFLFTQPGLRWHAPLHPPFPKTVTVKLAGSEVESVSTEERP
jgi:hypothetical protein